MATENLIKAVQNYEDYIRIKGADDKAIECYVMAIRTAYAENDTVYARRLSARGKQIINDFCRKQTTQDIFTLERYALENGESYKLLDFFYDILLIEAQNHILDSYLLYLERHRPFNDRFYLPRRKCFIKIGLIQALQDMVDDKLDILSISLPPGTGKCLKWDTNVLTPSGWCQIKDLNAGDKVISAEGRVSNVIGVYPQGIKHTYRLTFNDGSTVDASDDHLWKVQTRDDRRGGKYRIAKTEDILKNFRIENGKRANYSIDYVPKIDCFEPQEYFIHPYVLGAFLGDAHLSTSGVAFTKQECNMIDRINHLLGDYELVHKSKTRDNEYYLRAKKQFPKERESKMTKELKRLGLRGTVSNTKFIPREYLLGSYEQRLELLRGLLDTDGSVNGCTIQYSTASPMLAENVRELVHSLGGYCSITKSKAGYKDSSGNFIQCKDSYSAWIQFSADHPNPFWLPRKAEKYNPKRTVWKRYIENIEYVGEEECVCIYIDDPCHLFIVDHYIITHNTTLEKFFHSAICGWFPQRFNLFFSHSADITRMYYDGVLSILQDKEYAWREIFPKCKVTSTNAKMGTININKYKPFQNVMTASVGSEMAGKVRCDGYLLVDDMIGKIEEALNKNTLDKLWGIYSTDARQRKYDGCKEIHIATRWSVHDIIGRLQRAYEGNDRCRFIAVPDIDPKTDESNFLFDVNPLTKRFFDDQAMIMDDVTYRCLYKNDPIEREGQLYPEDTLRRYLTLPGREPDAIIGVCDTKTTGTDFMVLPAMYQFGDDYYMEDCICDDDSDFGVQEGRLSRFIVTHNLQQCEFESNAGGSRIAVNIDAKVKELGGRCNITTKPTETNKETRIIVNADWVKKHVLFKDKTLYSPKSDYGRFMNFLTGYTTSGKNPHDDVPDCLANFALNQTKFSRKASFEPIMNPFRTTRYYK